MIRSSHLGMNQVPGVDEVLCASQGYIGAHIINAVYKASVISPVNGAIACGGIAFTQKLIYSLSQKIVPDLGYKNLDALTRTFASYGLATYLTLKIMQVTGLILSMPNGVMGIGMLYAIVLSFAFLQGLISKFSDSEAAMQRHFQSKTFANAIFPFVDNNKTYQIRVICNPEQKTVSFPTANGVPLSCSHPYIFACNEDLPQSFFEKYPSFTKNSITFFNVFEGEEPLTYTANPTALPA